MTLYELSKDGYATSVDFSCLSADIGGDFKLYRDWTTNGMGAVVLAWPGPFSIAELSESEAISEPQSDKGDKSAVYASRLVSVRRSVIVSAPVMSEIASGDVRMSSIDLLQTDIAVQITASAEEEDITTLSALISNNTPFSLNGRTVRGACTRMFSAKYRSRSKCC